MIQIIASFVMLAIVTASELSLLFEMRKTQRLLKDLFDEEGYQIEDFLKR